MPVAVVVEPAAKVRELRFSGDVEAAAYFVVTEALTNALKHSSASRIVVRLTHRNEALTVEVADDGTGFRPADADGTGLTGMRDRVEALHGRLRVLSTSGGGTRVVVQLPAVALAAEPVPGPAPPFAR